MRKIPYLAAAWCAGYAVLAFTWMLGGPGFPFGTNDPRGAEMGSWLSGATPGWVGAVLSLACAAGAVAAGAVAVAGVSSTGVSSTGVSSTGASTSALAASHSPHLSRASRISRLAGFVLVPLAFVLLLVLPDVRILQNLAYSFGGFFGLVDWPVLNQALCVAGGILVGLTAVLALRRPPCAECNRAVTAPGERARWLRVGRWAVAVAIASMLPYGIQRAAWNLGVPLGVSQDFVDALHADIVEKGLHPAVMWILAGPDFGGALLTLGLVMAWGERFPRWVPYLGGRRVPISLAVVPATVVSIAVTVAGLAIYRFAITHGVSGSGVPGLLWAPWGLALATATLAYVMRRRRGCAGHEPSRARPEPATESRHEG